MAGPGIGAGDRRADVHGGKAIRRRDDFPLDSAEAGTEAGTTPAAGIWDNDDRDDAFAPVPKARASAGVRLASDDSERVPWLEPPDDDGDDEDAVEGGRIVGFLLITLAALALTAAAVWFLGNRGAGPGPADGSLIRAEPGPYKIPPETPGGATFEGTNDSSFRVSEGQNRVGKLAAQDDGSGESAGPGPAAAEATETPAAPAPGAVGVQLGAYTDAKSAEAAWSAIVQRNPTLSRFGHRVVEGRADIGQVHRLQAVTPDAATARSLCAELIARGQGCQVKR